MTQEAASAKSKNDFIVDPSGSAAIPQDPVSASMMIAIKFGLGQ
jgi:hypothetical protein